MISLTSPILKMFPCSAEAKGLLESGESMTSLVKELQTQQKSREALELMTRSMPPEDSVKFASKSIETSGLKLSDAESKTLEMINEGIAGGDDLPMAALEASADQLPLDSPVTHLAEAAKQSAAGDAALTGHFSSGSIFLTSNAAALQAADPLLEAPSSTAMKMPSMAEVKNPLIDLEPQLRQAQLPETELSLPSLPEMEVPTVEIPKLPGLPEPLAQPDMSLPESLLSEEQLSQAQQQLKPFIDLGLEMGKNLPGWA